MHVHAHFDQEFQDQPSAHTEMFVCTHGHTQPQPFLCHGLTKSNRTHKQHTLECHTVWVSVVWSYSLFSLPLSSSSPPPFSFSPLWFGRGAASCAPAPLLGRFCPTWRPKGLQGRKRIEQGWAMYGNVTVLTVIWYRIEEHRFIQWASVMLHRAYWVWQLQGLDIGKTAVVTGPHWAERDFHIGVTLEYLFLQNYSSVCGLYLDSIFFFCSLPSLIKIVVKYSPNVSVLYLIIWWWFHRKVTKY